MPVQRSRAERNDEREGIAVFSSWDWKEGAQVLMKLWPVKRLRPTSNFPGVPVS